MYKLITFGGVTMGAGRLVRQGGRAWDGGAPVTDLTVSEWAAQYRAAREALERIAGEPLVLWDSESGIRNECPGYGAIVLFTTETFSSVEWYANERQAQAAAALRHGSVVEVRG